MAAFVFNRLQYESGDWDLVDQRMPSNLLDSLAAYTTIDFDPHEAVVPLGSQEVLAAPFVYLSGHKLVQFTDRERGNFEAYTYGAAGSCSRTIATTTSTASSPRVSRHRWPRFSARTRLKKIPNDHPIYRAFFPFEKGPPTTSFELNGWGDDLVHDYLRAIEIDGRIAVLYSNKDYGCEWDYDYPQQAVSGRGQHKVRGEHHRPRDDCVNEK